MAKTSSFPGVYLSPEVAKELNAAAYDVVRTIRDIQQARERYVYRGQYPTEEQIVRLYYRELHKDCALLKLCQLVLTNIRSD